MKKNYSLKAKIAIFAACLTATSSLDAQVATTHTFSQSTGTFSAITGGTVVGGPTDDDIAYGGLNIGFQFQYNGTCYTQFGMCSDGYMTMGPVANYTGYNAISDPTADPNGISVFSNDIQLGMNVTSTVTIGSPVATVSSTNGISVGNLISTGYGFPAGTTVTAVGANSFTASANATSAITGASVRFANGEMRYQTLGTAPNRVLVVQWLNCRKFGGTSGRDDFYNFQARLYETSNKISIIYGTMINNSTPSTYEIGLRGTTNADFNSRTTATDWLTTTTSTVNTDACALNATLTPVSGLTFTWDNATDITPTLSLAVTGNTLNCGVSTTTNVITVSGANTYLWSNAATTSSITPTTTATTVYSVVGTATNNCTASKSSTIVVSPNPTVTITGSVICQGSSITASGANTYSWSTGASTASITPTVSNTYSVTGTDLVGCTGTAALSVTVNPLPTLTLAVTGNTLICGTTGTNVISATGANTYSWSTSATTPSINPTTTVTTVYSVVGTATTGCSSSQATTITVVPNPVVSAVSSTSLLCIGQTASLTASGASSYVWNTPSTSTVIAVSPTVTTSYTVTGTTNNCSASAVITQSVASCAGIKENSNSSLGVAIYPNPNNGEFTIELNNGLTKTIEVMDVTGRIVLTNTTLNDKLNMNATNLAAGVYYVKIKSNNAFEIVKIVKQ